MAMLDNDHDTHSNTHLYHSCGLLRGQLVLISLIWFNGAEFHGKVAFASCLNEWKIPELKSNIIPLNEIVVNGGFDWRGVGISAIFDGEFVILCMKTLLREGRIRTKIFGEGKLLDGI